MERLKILRPMARETKNAQLQIRVTPAQKAAIQQAADRAGLDLSAYVLSRALSVASVRFQEIVTACANDESPRFALAELNSLLTELTAEELQAAISTPPAVTLPPFLANYVAAMVEYSCARRSMAPPAWVRSVAPLAEPAFGSTLQSLRLYLLSHSPPPFRRRNLFIDASLGGQI